MLRFSVVKWIAGCLLIGLIACEGEQPALPPAPMQLPEGFPEMEVPADNPYTPARWALGKKLFYDPVMSVDSSLSCGSCHKPHLAFADEVAFSDGVKGRAGTRNVPSLANIGYHPYFTREGGVPTLEMQVLVPIQEHNEFDFNIIYLAERLQRDSMYVAMSREAYGREPDPYVITRALACFERSLISGNSRYDRFAFQGEEKALSAREKAGMELFFGESLGCASCHGGFDFTNYAFENNGLYEEYPDLGRFRLTGDPRDSARFKVPSLRNVALTAPYMHDGSMESLEAVINHYASGGKAHPQKSPLIQPFQLSEKEKRQLIAFLHSLTDESFLTNPAFQE
jgi:cytochrome c peroxidase